ncbi:MAG: T9SS type A sorting domain-containing protein [Bacteroidota bacterium]
MRVCLSALLALLIAGSSAAQSPVSLTLPDTIVYKDPGAVNGSAVSVPVVIQEDVTGRGIRGIDIVVSFDPTVIDLTSFVLGDLVPSSGCATFGGTDNGEINVRIACGSNTPLVGGPGTLVILEGTLVAEGATTLLFDDTTPFNEGGVDAAITNGRVRIVTDPDPSMSSFEDQTIDEDGSTEIEFRVSDADTDLEALAITGSASTDLVSADGFVVAACDGQTLMDSCRTLTVTPVANASGTATITVTATDNDSRSDDAVGTFELTVTPINDVPVVTAAIDDQDIPVGNLPRRIDLGTVFTDVEDTMLDYTASSSAEGIATVAIDGTDLILTPASVGTTTISVSAQDDENELAEDAFVLNVTSAVATDGDGPLAFRFRGATPNPTPGNTRVRFDLPSLATVTVAVFDAVGRQVVRTEARPMSPGANREVQLSMAAQPAGVYLVRVVAQSEGRVETLRGQVVVVR